MAGVAFLENVMVILRMVIFVVLIAVWIRTENHPNGGELLAMLFLAAMLFIV